MLDDLSDHRSQVRAGDAVGEPMKCAARSKTWAWPRSNCKRRGRRGQQTAPTGVRLSVEVAALAAERHALTPCCRSLPSRLALPSDTNRYPMSAKPKPEPDPGFALQETASPALISQRPSCLVNLFVFNLRLFDRAAAGGPMGAPQRQTKSHDLLDVTSFNSTASNPATLMTKVSLC